MKHRLIGYYLRIKDFGLKFFVRYHILGRKKGRRFKQQVVLDYIKKDMLKAGIKAKESEHKTNDDVQPIWVCWWQGEESRCRQS